MVEMQIQCSNDFWIIVEYRICAQRMSKLHHFIEKNNEIICIFSSRALCFVYHEPLWLIQTLENIAKTAFPIHFGLLLMLTTRMKAPKSVEYEKHRFYIRLIDVNIVYATQKKEKSIELRWEMYVQHQKCKS